MPSRPVSEIATSIVAETLSALEPGDLVRGAMESAGLGGKACSLLALGKGAAPMATAALGVLEARITGAIGVGPEGRGLGDALGKIDALEWHGADHPTPTARNVEAAGRVREFVAGLVADETLLVLLSGGASAMLCLPREPLTLGDVAAVTDALLRAGAPIGELNAVRKHCEVLKGGGLAAACGAGRVVALILSDVLGDRLDVIGSGPTAPDPTTFADALAVLERRGAMGASPAVTALLARGCAGEEPETVKPGDEVWGRVENRVIGSNRLATDAAAAACERAAYPVVGRREAVEGEAAEVGRALARAAREFAAGSVGPGAIVWGGETTVTVGDAPGRGGRNQELALAAAMELRGTAGITVLSLGTDGVDGPTDGAGGIVDGSTADAMAKIEIDPAEALRRHDSYHALDGVGALLRTGPTGTNVNDVMVALVR